MRNISRGKRVDNGKWIYGNIVFTHSGRAFKLEGSFFTGEKHEGDFKCGEIYGSEVMPETVGQFTGLTDKNGVKIFEGDIVKFISEVYEIAYIEKHARFAGKREDVALAVFPCEYAEVIGNVHDNPELLEQEG